METPECAPVSVGDMGTGYDMCAINEPGTVVDVAAGTGTFETLLAAAGAAGLVETLSDPNATLTVFAPVDAAFEGLDVEALLADPDGLRVILLNHVLNTKFMSTDLSDGQQVTMLGGSVVTVMIDGDKVMINNAVVTSVDVMASNGVIHILDAVLNFSVPPVMAPTNETMAPTPLMINVTNPVSGGPNVTATPTMTPVRDKDVEKCAEKNGQGCEACAGTAISNRQYCLYFADMETPECAPVSVGDMGTGYDMCAINEPGTVVDVAAGTGTFETLLAAAGAAGLVETLSDPNATLTVFAPVDAAFEGLDVEALLADPDGLRVILLNHVLNTKFMSTDLSDGQQVTMLGGSVVTVMIDGDKVMINNAVVTSVDVMASNGVIHILDAVLNFSVPPVMAPTNETMAPTPLMINVTNPVSGGPNVTAIPTPLSSAFPSVSPSTLPTATPSASPSTLPTTTPSASPSTLLTTTPSASPSTLPTATPSATPSTKPTASLTASPTVGPTEAPVTNSPTISPSSSTSIPTRPLNVGPDDSGSKVVGIKGGLMLSLIVSLFL